MATGGGSPHGSPRSSRSGSVRGSAGGSSRGSRGSPSPSRSPGPSTSGPTLGQNNDVLTIMVLGNKDAGKSALSRRFVYGKFKPAISLTNVHEELSQKIGFEVDVYGRPQAVDLAIMTLAPSGPDFLSKRMEGIRDCDGIILCFSCCHKSHFKALDEYKKLIMQYRHPYSVGVAVAGTNCDAREKDMKIKLDKATKWAQSWGPEWDVRFSQVNSPDGINVENPFYNAVQTFLEKKQQGRPQRQR